MVDVVREMMRQADREMLEEKEKWAKEYPTLLSVFIQGGKPNDLLIIRDEVYVLVNEFLAAKPNTVFNSEYK